MCGKKMRSPELYVGLSGSWLKLFCIDFALSPGVSLFFRNSWADLRLWLARKQLPLLVSGYTRAQEQSDTVNVSYIYIPSTILEALCHMTGTCESFGKRTKSHVQEESSFYHPCLLNPKVMLNAHNPPRALMKSPVWPYLLITTSQICVAGW